MLQLPYLYHHPIPPSPGHHLSVYANCYSCIRRQYLVVNVLHIEALVNPVSSRQECVYDVNHPLPLTQCSFQLLRHCCKHVEYVVVVIVRSDHSSHRSLVARAVPVSMEDADVISRFYSIRWWFAKMMMTMILLSPTFRKNSVLFSRRRVVYARYPLPFAASYAGKGWVARAKTIRDSTRRSQLLVSIDGTHIN